MRLYLWMPRRIL